MRSESEYKRLLENESDEYSLPIPQTDRESDMYWIEKQRLAVERHESEHRERYGCPFVPINRGG